MALETSDGAPTLRSDQDTSAQAVYGLSTRAMVVSIILLLVSLLWMRQAGLIAAGVQLGESVPVIPAIAVLLLLSAVGPLLNRLPRLFHFPRHQTLLVYVFLCIAVTMSSAGVVRTIPPAITGPSYFASPQNNYAQLMEEVPWWLAPKDHTVIRTMYEGSEGGVIPWGPWLVPLAVWTVFLLATFVVMYCLMLMFRQQWTEKEHLTFPIAQLVMEVSDYGTGGSVGSFLRNPLMWTGFGLTAFYNVMNMLNAWNPAIPCLGKFYDLGGLLTERPWSALQPTGFLPLAIHWRPESFGIGYLVSTDVLLSVWVSYLLLRFSNFMAVIAGYEISGFPFDEQQVYGAYVAMGLFLIWVGREHLGRILRKAFTADKTIDDSHEPYPYRTVVWAMIIGFATMLFIPINAGMWPATAVVFFGAILLFSITYARIRSEAGTPVLWMFPRTKGWQMLPFIVTGSAPFQRGTSFSNLTILTLFCWLKEGYFLTLGAYQIESLKIAEKVHIRQRTVVKWMILALLIGLIGAYYLHIQAYYSYGANILGGSTSQAYFRGSESWSDLSLWVDAHGGSDMRRTTAVVVGLFITTVLILLRSLFLRFPLHPLGYVMGTSQRGGEVWGPFFLVWIIKSVILRLGGMRLYRQLIPFFLGLVLGHYFAAGVVWGSISLINEMYRRYIVWF